MNGIVRKIISTISAAAVAFTVMTVSSAPGNVAEAATGGCDGTHGTGWTAWTSANSLPNNVSTGKYYLTTDVVVTQHAYHPSGFLYICLNGHTITATNNSRIFYNKSGELYLYDCKKSGKLTGGNPSSDDYDGNGGAIYGQGGYVYLYDVTISGNTAKSGGAVYLLGGGLSMDGGTITNNTATENGGGLYSGFRSLDGKVDISGNTVNGSPNNVCLSGSRTITIGNGFDASSKIGVNTIATPTCANPIAVTKTTNSDISNSFTADKDGQIIVFNDDKVQLSGAHSATKTEAKAATCTKDGNIEYWKCSTCSKYFSNSACTSEITLAETVIGKTVHTYGAWTTTKAATCTSTGTKERSCTNGCGAKETETIEKTAHNYVGGKCNVCSAVDPAHTHTGGTATCKKKAVCTICDKEYGEFGAHTWSEWQTTAATCKAEGKRERTCANGCGAKETETIEKTAHNYVGGKCNVCSAVDPAHTHTGGTATCKKKAVCTICREEYGELAEHNYGAWSVTKNPTETATGTAQRTCSFGENETKTDVPALSDSTVWTKVEGEHVDPTEDVDGKDVYTSIYGTVTVTLPSKGHTHTWGAWSVTKNPTLTATGTAERACSCGEQETKTDVPALSDSTVWTKDTTKHVDATATTPGKDVYRSATYGEIEIRIPATGGGNSGNNGNTGGNSGSSNSGSSSSSSNGSSSGSKTPSIAEVELDGDVPETEIAASDKDLKDAILSKAELAAIEDGDDISFILQIKDADPGADKQTVETRLGSTDGFKVGQYVDVSLFKVVNGSETKLAKINKPIKIRFEIPEELRANGRTFAVIRVHNGAATLLRDLDNDSDTITIETDKFSTYALIYSDSPKAAANPSTGAAAAIFPTALLAAAAMLLSKRRKN